MMIGKSATFLAALLISSSAAFAEIDLDALMQSAPEASPKGHYY